MMMTEEEEEKEFVEYQKAYTVIVKSAAQYKIKKCFAAELPRRARVTLKLSIVLMQLRLKLSVFTVFGST